MPLRSRAWHCSSARAPFGPRAMRQPLPSTGSAPFSSAAPSRSSCSAWSKLPVADGPIPWCGDAWPRALRWPLAFAIVELRRRHPLLDVRLFTRPDFATGSIGITFLFFANFGFFFLVMQYMQLILGYSPLETAWALGPVAVPIIVLGATMHLILPKVGLRLVVSVGLLLMAVGLFSMKYLEADSSYIDLVWPFLITSAGIGLCVAPTTSAIMNAVPDRQAGRRVGGERRDPRSRSGGGHRRRGIGARRAVHPCDGSWAECIPREHPRRSDRLAGKCAGNRQTAWAAGACAGTARRVGVLGCDGPFADRRVDGPGCGGGIRRGLGARQGRSSARVRCPAHCPFVRRRRTRRRDGRASRSWRVDRGR